MMHENTLVSRHTYDKHMNNDEFTSDDRRSGFALADCPSPLITRLVVPCQKARRISDRLCTALQFVIYMVILHMVT